MTTPPDIPVKPVRRSLWERLSVVWLIPMAALAIALGVAWQSYADRGPLLRISFESASGVKAKETVLRYRDVTVGLVEKVGFSASLERVDVDVRLEKEIADFVDADAEFWVVRPEVTTQGVTGLDTVLSGVFIEGLWDTEPGGFVARHEGLDAGPLLRVGESGVRITLRAQGDTVLTENSPILYKGITVGRLGKPRLSGDGTMAAADAVIYAPHDQLISTATRFWDTSGFSFSIGAGGAALDFSSLASLVSGGVTFETIVSGGVPVEDGAVFDVDPDETTARARVFSDSSGPTLSLAVVFDENVSGLSAGSSVEFTGVKIGEVTSLRGLVDEERFGDTRVRLLASIEIRPERLGLEDGITPDSALEFLAERVADGLRARLGTSSILTGGLKIELIREPDAPPATIETGESGLPIIPSTESNVQDVAATAQGVLQRVNDLPIEELIGSVIQFLDNASALVGNEDVQKVPGEIIGLVEDARGVIGAEEVQRLPDDIGNLMNSLQGATEELQKVLVALEEADAVNRLLAAIESAGLAAAEVSVAMEGVPALLAEVESVANKANALAIEDLLDQATGLVTSMQDFVGNEDTQALPATVNAAMEDLQKVVADIAEEDGVARLLTAIDAAGVAADSAADAFDGLPELITQLSGLSDKVGQLPLDQLVQELTAVAEATDTLLSSEGARDLPASLSAAMADLRTIIAEISEQDGVARLLASIDAAGTAATTAGEAFDGVPALVDQLSSVAQKADELPLTELLDQLTSVADAAEALLASEGAQDLPATLTSSLSELQIVMRELREGGTVENVNATLASAARASDAVSRATTDLPRLISRVNALISQATTTLTDFDGQSPLNRDLRSALREVQKAASAFASLSRALERRPNSIILGR